jgi:hypothetical protein
LRKQFEALKYAQHSEKPVSLSGLGLSEPGLSTQRSRFRWNPLPRGLVIKEVPGMGEGVFLGARARQIFEGTFVGFYSGEYTVRRSGDKVRRIADAYLFNLFEASLKASEARALFKAGVLEADDIAYTTIDRGKRLKVTVSVNAATCGNFTRYINHATNGNLKPYLVHYRGTAQVALVASKTIEPGEQLLYAYRGKDEEQSYADYHGFTLSPVTPQTYMLDAQGDVYKTLDSGSESDEDMAFPEVDSLLNVKTSSESQLSEEIGAVTPEPRRSQRERKPNTRYWNDFHA